MQCRLSNTFTRSANTYGGAKRIILTYIVSGGIPVEINDPGRAALDLVREEAPEELSGIPRQELNLIRTMGGGVYEIQVEYALENKHKSGKKAGDRLWSFDSAIGSERIYHGELIKGVGKSSYLPDPGEMVNWNGRYGENMVVSGINKVVVSLREFCVATMRYSEVTTSYLRTLLELTGGVNEAPFRHWNSGEVLFLGASSGTMYQNSFGSKLIDLTFRFAIKPNRQEAIYSGINLGEIQGWDIPWSIEGVSPNGKEVQGVSAYVSRIYPRVDFKHLRV